MNIDIPMFLVNCKAITYYKYRSTVKEQFMSIRYNTVSINDQFFGENKEDLFIYKWFVDLYKNIKLKNKNKYIDTNKIVFKCKTEEGSIFFVGWYDGTISLGLSVYSDIWLKPVKLKN